MLAMTLADFLLNGGWTGPAVGTGNQDIYGSTITVGSYVKMVGLVTAINLTDSHFGEIQVTPVHPGTLGPAIPWDANPTPRSPNFTPGNPQLLDQQRGFHPKQLILGV